MLVPTPKLRPAQIPLGTPLYKLTAPEIIALTFEGPDPWEARYSWSGGSMQGASCTGLSLMQQALSRSWGNDFDKDDETDPDLLDWLAHVRTSCFVTPQDALQFGGQFLRLITMEHRVVGYPPSVHKIPPEGLRREWALAIDPLDIEDVQAGVDLEAGAVTLQVPWRVKYPSPGETRTTEEVVVDGKTYTRTVLTPNPRDPREKPFPLTVTFRMGIEPVTTFTAYVATDGEAL